MKDEEMEDELQFWILMKRDARQRLTRTKIKEKAIEISRHKGNTDFKVSEF